MDKQERDELIEKYLRAFADFEEALLTIPREVWKFKPEPKEWSIHEVIVHLADSETNSFLRARRLIADPGETLMGYDQDHWANNLNYHDQDWKRALEITRLVRESTYALIRSLPEEVWANTATHPEYDDPYTFEQWLEVYANHPYAHREQVLKNYEIWKKANPDEEQH
jgi:hypothetical protein